MSSLVVKVVEIDEVRAHPNADALAIAVVGGWQVVVKKGEWQAGAIGTYFPLDTMLPLRWTDEFGVSKYCQTRANDPQFDDYARIRCTRLRGEPSFGLLVPRAQAWATGTDVTEYYSARKYEPPVKTTDGDAEQDHPLFVQYTDIENLRHFPDIFALGEDVVITEKIDGSNVRVGLIEGEWMAGSHRLRRKQPEDLRVSRYWYPLTTTGVRELLGGLGKQVILFGEVHGPGIQGNPCERKKLSFLAFDLLVEGGYLPSHVFASWCRTHGVPTVPVLYSGPYSLDVVRQHASGTTYSSKRPREGVVVRPITERTDPRIGRVICKYVNDDVLLDLKREDATDA